MMTSLDTTTLASVESKDLDQKAVIPITFREEVDVLLRIPLPLCLACAGGTWSGYLLKTRFPEIEITITGFPPVEVSQHIDFFSSAIAPDGETRLFSGIIQDIRVESGSSPWDGLTYVRLRCRWEYTHPDRVWTGEKRGPLSLSPDRLFAKVINKPRLSERRSHAPAQQKSRRACFLNVRSDEPSSQSAHSGKPGIQSSRVYIDKQNGQHISAFYDRMADTDHADSPLVIIAPGYGETKREYLTLSYYFVSNGFRVVRYDHTNHVGESDGSHFDISLSSMKDDFQTVNRYAKTRWPHAHTIGVATSLASRAAIKAEAECPSLSLLVLCMGIVNVQRSAATVHQEDLFRRYERGEIPESANILGFNVGNHFLQDALTHHFVTLEDTLQDAKTLASPVLLISGGRDAWVSRDDVQAFGQSLGRLLSRWVIVPDALHRIQENPRIARNTYSQVVALCHELMRNDSSPVVIHTPSRMDLGRQNREEKRAMAQYATTEVGQPFWKDYLDHFQSIGQCRDYVKLLDHIFHALGPVSPGQRVLDAGCGNGNAGIFLMKRMGACRRMHPSRGQHEAIRYTGIDVVPEALQRARLTMESGLLNCQELSTVTQQVMHCDWAQVDLSRPLPFPDNSFERIISNLVLGYIGHPGAVVKELYRVLAPGGRMVITNLKPNGDFSEIYKNLVSESVCREQRQEARVLLNNYGKIRQAEMEGQFCFFDRQQWETIIEALACNHAGIYPTFAGQAYLVVIEKPAVLAKTNGICQPAIPPLSHAAEPMRWKRVA